jgi:4-hydroxy-2-oxoheptanedioate aldolase
MPEATRLNKMIELLEQRKAMIGACFDTYGIREAIRLSRTDYDFCMWDMEHTDHDFTNLRTVLQFMLDRRVIYEQGTLQPSVVPMVRVSPNAWEHNAWQLKLTLDAGTYTVMVPLLETFTDLEFVVKACRFASAQGEPKGRRGQSPNPVRYWGLASMEEYIQRADIWPLNPGGELLLIPLIESVGGLNNLRDILSNGRQMVGCVAIGLGDLSISLGHPWQFDHPAVRDAFQQFMEICREYDVPYGTGGLTAENAEQQVADGFLYLATNGIDLDALSVARKLTGRTE